MRYFAHQPDGIFIWIIEKGQPEIVIGHLRHQMGLLQKHDLAGGKRCIGRVNVRHAKVEDCSAGLDRLL